MKRHLWLILTRTGLQGTPAEQTLGFDVDQGPAEGNAFNFLYKKNYSHWILFKALQIFTKAGSMGQHCIPRGYQSKGGS